TGKLSLHSEPLDLVALVRAAVELAEAPAHALGLQLAARLPEAPCYTRGDAARLSQVFSNLLNNACRYTPAGGRIDVEMHVLEDDPGARRAEIEIRDTGVGIEPAMQQ